MSDTASIYVHLDWHIGHYVKILMDEVFGEDNFINEIVWKKYGGVKNNATNKFTTQHETIFYYSIHNEKTYNLQYRPMSEKYINDEYKYTDEKGRQFAKLRGRGYQNNEKTTKIKYLDEALGTPITTLWDDSNLQLNTSSNESVDYATQKPEALLERIIKASSNAGMIVADFFGGSGVTAKVAHDLGRNFIHTDVGINSIQTVRDRLKLAGASFDILDVKDGVSLFRNPVQTMDKLKSLITGLVNQDGLDSFWEGSINDSKLGAVPVYIPNLLDHSTKVLDIPMINRIINEAMIDLPDNTKQVIVYYIDIDDKPEVEKFIKEYNNTQTNIELRDLKEILDEVVLNDVVDFQIVDKEIEITKFISDRLIQKIDEYNQKQRLKSSKAMFNDERLMINEQEETINETDKQLNIKHSSLNINISDNGLELIELIALDCTNKDGLWHSDHEIKIDKKGFVTIDDKKTKEFWNGKIIFKNKPLRLKIRNIAGDETVLMIND